MTAHRTFNLNDPLPSGFIMALQQLLGSFVSENFRVTTTATQAQVVAGTGNDQRSIAIGGQMRYITATVSATHSAGGSGGASQSVYVTAQPLNNAQEDARTFDYSFALAVQALNTPPAGLSRHVADLIYTTGVATPHVRPVAGMPGSVAPLAVGVAQGGLDADGLANYSFRAHLAANGAYSRGDTLPLTESYDIGGVFGSSTFTAPIAGVWAFMGAVTVMNNTAGNKLWARLRGPAPDGALVPIALGSVASTAGTATSTVATTVDLDAGQTVSLNYDGDVSTNTLMGSAQAAETFLCGWMVGRRA